MNALDHVAHKLRGWCHRRLEEVDDGSVETLPERREALEVLLARGLFSNGRIEE
jgi:hypothetical protein